MGFYKKRMKGNIMGMNRGKWDVNRFGGEMQDIRSCKTSTTYQVIVRDLNPASLLLCPKSN